MVEILKLRFCRKFEPKFPKFWPQAEESDFEIFFGQKFDAEIWSRF